MVLENRLEKGEKNMNGEQRRLCILQEIKKSQTPCSGTYLANKFGVSRQVIVQDIALLRASNHNIVSTTRGYICQLPKVASCVMEVEHDSEHIEDELNTIVDMGGSIVDVWVEHEVYGRIKAPLSITSRLQVQNFMKAIKNGTSIPMLNLTSKHHFHTIEAENIELLQEIQRKLKEKGYLISVL